MDEVQQGNLYQEEAKKNRAKEGVGLGGGGGTRNDGVGDAGARLAVAHKAADAHADLAAIKHLLPQQRRLS